MPKPASTRPAYKMLTCIYLCRTLLFFAPYADFSKKKEWKGIPNELLFLEKKYKNEYKIAACLVGLRLGFDSIHELYYDYVKKNSEYKSNENLISEI